MRIWGGNTSSVRTASKTCPGSNEIINHSVMNGGSTWLRYEVKGKSACSIFRSNDVPNNVGCTLVSQTALITVCNCPTSVFLSNFITTSSSSTRRLQDTSLTSTDIVASTTQEKTVLESISTNFLALYPDENNPSTVIMFSLGRLITVTMMVLTVSWILDDEDIPRTVAPANEEVDLNKVINEGLPKILQSHCTWIDMLEEFKSSHKWLAPFFSTNHTVAMLGILSVSECFAYFSPVPLCMA